MMIHCALSAQHLQRFAAGSPYIYTGDFNIKPPDSMYRLLTEGTVAEGDPNLPVVPPWGWI
jgi:endonuclease/exonuclease/phosphatase family metal-dependent hydrolase